MRKLHFACVLILAAVFAGCADAKGNDGPDLVSAPSALGWERPSIMEAIPPYEGNTRTLVVYYSQGAATEWLAEDIAAIFGSADGRADVEKIVEAKERKKNLIGFMTSGFQSSFGIASRIVAPVRDPSAYDRVFVLTPIWSWHLSPPVRAWLKAQKGRLPASAFVTVSGDTDPEKVVAAMTKASGTTSVAFVGFAERDFRPENREYYVEKLRSVIDPMR